MLVMRAMKKRIKEIFAQLAYIPATLRLIWAAAPRWTSAWLVLLAMQGLVPATLVYLTKLVVDSLVTAIRSGGGWTEVKPALIYAGLAAGAMLLTQVLESSTDWVKTAQSELVQDYIKGLVHKKSAEVDISFYESPEFYDRLDQTRGEASSRSLTLLESGGSIMQNGLTLVAMAAVLLTYSLWIPVILVVSTIPAFLVVLHFDQQYHRWWQESTIKRRWAQYYDVMLTHGGAASEMRLFGLGGRFQAAYQDSRREVRTERLRQLKRQSFGRSAAGVTSMLAGGCTLLWIGWRSLHGAASLGDLARLLPSIQPGAGSGQCVAGKRRQDLCEQSLPGKPLQVFETAVRNYRSTGPQTLSRRRVPGY
jgi:ATP-binding cassette subfamily B protein